MARAGLTLDRLTIRAAEMADAQGLEKVTVSAVARSLGVKDASLYSHIRNAHHLRTRIAVLAIGELADRVATALAGRAGKEALVGFANAYRTYAQEHQGRYASMRIVLDEETLEASASARHSAMAHAILRGYGLTEPAETDAVRLLLSTFHGYVSLELIGGFSHQLRPSEDSWKRTLDALDFVLRNWPRD
jgi:AcrR family transcriptional regulator